MLHHSAGKAVSMAITPPISLLVPAHNEEKSIVASLSSLLELDYPDLEVIVVNDGSEGGLERCANSIWLHRNLLGSSCEQTKRSS